jgi:hypothetical protein
VLVASGLQTEALNVALRASWIADDDADLEVAQQCRRAALWLLRRQDASNDLLRLELHRRLGEFETAAARALPMREMSCDPSVVQVAEFQLSLSLARNAERHSMVDLFALERTN